MGPDRRRGAIVVALLLLLLQQEGSTLELATNRRFDRTLGERELVLLLTRLQLLLMVMVEMVLERI